MNKKLLGLGIIPTSMLVPMIVSCNEKTVDDNINNNNNGFVSKEDFINKVESVDSIKPNESARWKIAYGWKVEDITSENFDNVPVSNKDLIVKVISVENYPEKEQIDVTIQFATPLGSQVSIIDHTRVYEVTGFRKETLDEKVDRIYGDIKIKPTKESIQIPAMEENWKFSDINDNNFINLPKNKEGIKVELLDNLEFDNSDPLQGTIILTYKFSWKEEIHSIERKFKISGFEKATLNSNIAAQNHYKLVALYRMVDVKSNINRSKTNTREIEEGGIDKVKEIFNLPTDREYNLVTLQDVISSSDNTIDTYNKGKNMKLGSVKLKFSIFDWVNNNRSIVETEIFEGFENPLNYWDDLFKKSVKMKTVISDSLFSFKDHGYWSDFNSQNPSDRLWSYNGSTYNKETGQFVLNATNRRKDGSYVEFGAYSLALSDWVGYKKGTTGSFTNGVGALGMNNVSLDRSRFINMVTIDAKKNYFGKGPNNDKANEITTPIKQGGISEVLRRYLFNNIKNQDIYQYDWIAFKRLVEPKYHDKQVSWSSIDSNDGIPFGYMSTWVNTTYEYDIWLDYIHTTIKFDVSLGMVDVAKNQGSNNGWA